MTKVIARIYPVHLMNVDWAPGGRQPSDQANRLGLWVGRKKGSYHPPFTIVIYYYYSYLFYRPRHCSKGAQPVPKALHRSGCRDKRSRPRCDSYLGPVTPQSDALTTIGHCDLQKWLNTGQDNARKPETCMSILLGSSLLCYPCKSSWNSVLPFLILLLFCHMWLVWSSINIA